MSLHISLWVTLLLSVLAAVANVSTQLSAAQTSAARLRSQVTLDFRSAAVSVLPLPADDPAHQPLLSATADGRVRVAQIEIGAPFELGGIELELPTPVGGRPSPVTRYDMWLATASDHWTIVLALAEGDEASEPIDVVGTFRVAHDTHDATTATLTGGLIATGGDGARLMLQWGCHVWTADGQFMPLRRPSFAGGGGREPPQAEPRSRDWDSSGVRRLGMLGTRNEVAVTLLDGSRLATVYPKDLKVEDRDFAHLVSVASGAVVRVTAGAATKLEMDVRLQFGDLTLENRQRRVRGHSRRLWRLAQAGRRRMAACVQRRARCLGHTTRSNV